MPAAMTMKTPPEFAWQVEVKLTAFSNAHVFLAYVLD
jgi:hypothetical protein